MSNYNLSNILCKVLFVITFAFSNWQAFMLVSNILGGDNSVVIAIISALLLGVVLVSISFSTICVCTVFLVWNTSLL